MIGRQRFLAGALAGLASPLLAAGSADAAPAAFDPQALTAILDRPARHRQVFAVERIDGGYPLWDILAALNGYQFGFKEGPGTLHAVAVLYNSAVILGLDNTLWAKYPFGRYAAAVGDKYSLPSAGVNPFMRPHSSLNPKDDPDDAHGYYRDYSLTALRKRGVSFLVDDDSLLRMCLTMQAAGRIPDAAATLAQCRSHLIPGAMLVPTAASAIDAAEEAHFTYYYGS